MRALDALHKGRKSLAVRAEGLIEGKRPSASAAARQQTI